MNTVLKTYYNFKDYIPREVQIYARRFRAEYIRKKIKDQWLYNRETLSYIGGNIWKENKKFCLVLTHDVDTEVGIHRCKRLLDIEEEQGFVSSFSIVPERYPIPHGVIEDIEKKGFEVCVHGVNHDGRLFSSRTEFDRRKKLIEMYAREWGAVGFRAPAMHHNLLWISEMDIQYDMSTYEFDPLEPQGGGVGTLFPFMIENGDRKIVELPYTLPQDHSLFVVLRQNSIDTWMKKVEWIAQNGGMALLITHPDYMNFRGGSTVDEYDVKIYVDFLKWIKKRFNNSFWNPLPREVAIYWKSKEDIARKVGRHVSKHNLLCERCRKNINDVILK